MHSLNRESIQGGVVVRQTELRSTDADRAVVDEIRGIHAPLEGLLPVDANAQHVPRTGQLAAPPTQSDPVEVLVPWNDGVPETSRLGRFR